MIKKRKKLESSRISVDGIVEGRSSGESRAMWLIVLAVIKSISQTPRSRMTLEWPLRVHPFVNKEKKKERRARKENRWSLPFAARLVPVPAVLVILQSETTVVNKRSFIDLSPRGRSKREMRRALWSDRRCSRSASSPRRSLPLTLSVSLQTKQKTRIPREWRRPARSNTCYRPRADARGKWHKFAAIISTDACSVSLLICVHASFYAAAQSDGNSAAGHLRVLRRVAA